MNRANSQENSYIFEVWIRLGVRYDRASGGRSITSTRRSSTPFPLWRRSAGGRRSTLPDGGRLHETYNDNNNIYLPNIAKTLWWRDSNAMKSTYGRPQQKKEKK